MRCEREPRNREDPYTVATKIASGTIVGHVPRSMSCVYATFLCHSSSNSCTITGSRRHNQICPQGGLELPCTNAFACEDRRLLQKAKKCLEEDGEQVDKDVRFEDDGIVMAETSVLTTLRVDSDFAILNTSTTSEAAVTRNDTTTVATATCSTTTTTKCSYITVEHSYAAQQGTSSEVLSPGWWLKVRDISLTDGDRRILGAGDMLIDRHVNFAQRLLKGMFPEINGLRLTLLQDKEHKEPTMNSMQILHVNGNHWVCAATTPKGRQVNVYDSSFSNWDQSSYKALQFQFRCSTYNIKFVNGVQKQTGAADCGLFAISNATAYHSF